MSRKFYKWMMVLTIGLTPAAFIGTNVIEAKTSADFRDLKDLDAATKAKIDAMISAGIFDGVSEGTFGLVEEMNRAQFAKVAARIYNLPINWDLKTSSFSDVKVDDAANGYALPFIEALKIAGITDGFGDGTYNPEGNVTKEQLATFLVRGLGKDREASLTTPVSDSTVSNWASGYVSSALQLGLLSNSPDGTFGGKDLASRELLVTGSFETARTIEETKPLEVSGADFVVGNKLHLTLTAGVNADSVDLSKIMINGVPLDPKLNSYELSEDRKSIIIKLHEGFQLDLSKTPVITVNGLITLFGNMVKNEESKTIPVKLTVPPINSITPVIPMPVPTLDESSNPDLETDSSNEPATPDQETGSSNESPNPDGGTGSPNEPNNPNEGTGSPNEPNNPNQGTGSPNEPNNPNQGTGSPNEPNNPNQGTGSPNEPNNPNQGLNSLNGQPNQNQ
ncbi:MAG: S-layer homology domain-containing protein [Solibacillus sp.]